MPLVSKLFAYGRLAVQNISSGVYIVYPSAPACTNRSISVCSDFAKLLTPDIFLSIMAFWHYIKRRIVCQYILFVVSRIVLLYSFAQLFKSGCL